MTKSSKSEFVQIINDHLVPMFPGSNVEGESTTATRKGQLVSIKSGALALLVRETENKDAEVVEIKRIQKFTKEEQVVAQKFMEVYERLRNSINEPYYDDTAESSMSQVVSKVLGGGDQTNRLISMLSSWSRQTYEGGRIAFSLGINVSKPGTGPHVLDLKDEDFVKVLSNGYDSMIEIGHEGNVIGHCILPTINESIENFSPLRLQPLCNWTANGDDRIALSLNWQGEVIAIKSGELVFANRRGRWRYFSHESAIAQFTRGSLAPKTSAQLKHAVYQTALDVAFSRTGGCIGIVAKNNRRELEGDNVIRERDLIDSMPESQGNKAKTLASILENSGKSKFQELDRNLRQELVSIDGATVLGHDGEIISIGAILGVKGGAKTGGGRQAAAETLAGYGLGIKISNDGYIRVLVREKKKSDCTVAAEVG